MIYKILPLILFCILSFKPLKTADSQIKGLVNTDPKLIAANSNASFVTKCKSVYSTIDANNLTLPKFDSFLALSLIPASIPSKRNEVPCLP